MVLNCGNCDFSKEEDSEHYCTTLVKNVNPDSEACFLHIDKTTRVGENEIELNGGKMTLRVKK